jgi:hypothetical protein
MNCPDFHKLYSDFITDPSDEMAVAAAVLMGKASCGVQEACNIFAAGFAAGYVVRAKHQVVEEAAEALAEFEGRAQ